VYKSCTIAVVIAVPIERNDELPLYLILVTTCAYTYGSKIRSYQDPGATGAGRRIRPLEEKRTTRLAVRCCILSMY